MKFAVWAGFLLAFTLHAAEPPPRNLTLHLALLRFQPKDKLDLIRPFKGLLEGQVKPADLSAKGMNAVIEGLSAHGVVDVLHRSERVMVLGSDGKAKFDAIEERPFVLIGNKDMPSPGDEIWPRPRTDR